MYTQITGYEGARLYGNAVLFEGHEVGYLKKHPSGYSGFAGNELFPETLKCVLHG
jgi:hypothetical protein